MARRYSSIQIVELPRIFRYADNETVAVMASGLRTEGQKVRVRCAKVRKDQIEQFLNDFQVCEERSRDIPVPPQVGGAKFTLRLPPGDSIFGRIQSKSRLGDLAEIHQGVHWNARTDDKPKTAPRTDVAANKEKKGFHRGAEKMNGNLAQFQLRTIRYLSLLDKDQDPSTSANKRSWEKRKVVS